MGKVIFPDANKRKRKRSVRRDLLVLTWDKLTGNLRHVSKCHTEKGAAMSERYVRKFDPDEKRLAIQIVDAAMLKQLGSATTRSTEIAELEALFLRPGGAE